MLKRNDLAKQFELVVKQECINHQREIEQSNAKVRELEEKVIEISVLFEKERSKRQECHHSQVKSLDKLEKDLLDICSSMQSSMNDLRSQIESLNSHLIGINLRTEKNINSLRYLDEKLKTLDDYKQTLSIRMQTDKVQLQGEIANVYKKFEDTLIKTKLEIFNRPFEKQVQFDEMSVQLGLNNSAISSFKTELEKLKKKVVVEKCYREYLFDYFGINKKG